MMGKWQRVVADLTGVAILTMSGCVSTPPSSPPQQDLTTVVPSATIRLLPPDERGDVEAVLGDELLGLIGVQQLMLIRYEDGQPQGGSGSRYRWGKTTYRFLGPGWDYEAAGNSIGLFFDQNGNHRPDPNEVLLVSESPLRMDQVIELRGEPVRVAVYPKVVKLSDETRALSLPPSGSSTVVSIEYVGSFRDGASLLFVFDSLPDIETHQGTIGLTYRNAERSVTGAYRTEFHAESPYLEVPVRALPQDMPLDLEIGVWPRGGMPEIVRWDDATISGLIAGVGTPPENWNQINDPVLALLDRSDLPAPPTAFEERESGYGVWLVDQMYSDPIWLYPDMTIDDIALLFPNARVEEERIFHLDGGGFVVTGYRDDGTLRVFYPRGTDRFTVPGAPLLPWDRITLLKRFSAFAAGSLTEERSVQFIRENSRSLPGFRIDSENLMVTGFRILFPE